MKLTAMMPQVKQPPTNGSNVLKIKELQRMTMSSLANLNFTIQTSECPGEKHYPWKSTDCPTSCKRGWNTHWFMSHNFNEDLGMHWVSAKFVPKLLNDDLLQRANDDECLLKNVITSDEMCVYS
jgi:hypothetical protein